MSNFIISQVQSVLPNPVFDVEFSMWSPEGVATNVGEDPAAFASLRDAILTSIRSLYCMDESAFVCVVRDDSLLTTTQATAVGRNAGGTPAEIAQAVQENLEKNPDKTLLMATVGEITTTDTWSTWTVSVEIVQLGRDYIKEIMANMDEDGMSVMTIHDVASKLLDGKIVSDMNALIEDKSFDDLLHANLEGMDGIMTSQIGAEADVFPIPEVEITTPNTTAPAVTKTSPPATDESTTATNANSNSAIIDEEDDDSNVVLTAVLSAFAIMLVACIGFVCFYKKHQQKAAAAALERQKIQDSAPTPALVDNADVESYSEFTGVNTNKDTDAEATSNVGGESVATGLASWQYKPQKFVLKSEASQSDAGDESAFKAGGSIVAKAAANGSVMGQSVDSSLDGWSVNSNENKLTWA